MVNLKPMAALLAFFRIEIYNEILWSFTQIFSVDNIPFPWKKIIASYSTTSKLKVINIPEKKIIINVAETDFASWKKSKLCAD